MSLRHPVGYPEIKSSTYALPHKKVLLLPFIFWYSFFFYNGKSLSQAHVVGYAESNVIISWTLRSTLHLSFDIRRTSRQITHKYIYTCPIAHIFDNTQIRSTPDLKNP